MSQSSRDTNSQFSVVRSFLWPIYRSELSKVLPILALLLLISFNYSILLNLKDSILITSSGAEVIPAIKFGVLLPMAVIMTVIFAKLSNRYSQERVFYIMISIFLVFFAIFAYVLYPLHDVIHPHAFAKKLQASYPSCKWFITIIENWSFSLFYVMSELWGTVVLQVIFWGFANEVTRVDEARRFYSIFSIGGSIAKVFASIFVIFFISSGSILENALNIEQLKEVDWQHKFQWIIATIIFCGIITMALFHWINKHVFNDSRFETLHKVQIPKRVKIKQSLRESFYHLKNSKYLLCIATLVISYNLSINLVEVVWKDQVKQLYPVTADMMRFMSYVSLSMGILSTLTAFSMSHLIGRLGWTFTALLTPITMLITSVCFFSFLLFKESLGPIASLFFGATPLAITVFVGAVQNIFCKAAKYSVFDATKEMSFIPLDHDSKLKGKAAIDGIGSRLGKSGGSLIHTGLLMIFHTLSNSSPFVACILLVVIVGWTIAVQSLGQQFQELTSPEEIPSEPKPHPTLLANAKLAEG